MDISIPQHDTPQRAYERERLLAAQRGLYEWSHVPGLPPLCRGIPAPEVFEHRKSDNMKVDLAASLLDGAASVVGWLTKHRHSLKHYDTLYALERPPAVIRNWWEDREFANQRMNGINPFLITSISEIPDDFPVTDEIVGPILPDGTTLARLLDERRLFVCDWRALDGVPINAGRFQTAPILLLWLDERRVLMPLAIQLGPSPAEAPVIFTPADPWWLWLTARTYVASAEGSYHEIVAHLTRTHLVMEPIWVAACRTLPPQHPLHQLLQPHFTGTISINDEAVNDLIVPGGPIDTSISVGTDGAYWLVDQEYRSWRFDDWNPRTDLSRRGVLDPDVLPGYHYRDDALELFDAIGRYVDELLRVFYRSDDDVRGDAELQAFAREVTDDTGGRLRGSPIGDAQGFGDVTTLVAFVQQVIHTVSVEHAAVNNGQWDQFGYIPNTPGAMYMPPPTTKHTTDEARLTYALPSLKASVEQMALVHLLSEPTMHCLGSYPSGFFASSIPAQRAVDRFRSALDAVATRIDDRNRDLVTPYTYLLPSDVGRSIAI